MSTTVPTNEKWIDCDGKEWPVHLRREDASPMLVSFGKGGNTVYFGKGHTCHEYDVPESWFRPSRWWTHDHAERRDPEQFEGIRYIDVCPAVDNGDGVKMAISGPMVNVELPVGEIDRCPEPSAIMASAMAENTFGSLLTLQRAHNATGRKYGPLDSVDIETYVRLWHEAGAVTGFIRNGEFVPD